MNRRALVLAFFVIALAACQVFPPPRLTPVRLQLVGSSSMQWLAQTVSQAYTQHHPNVTFTIQAANSDHGLRATQEISGTIGMVSRVVQPAELDGMRAVVVGRDGVAVIVNKNNPINAMTRSQIADVFSGKILTWPLGPSASKLITAVSREEGSGTRAAFEAMAMNGQRVTRTAVIMPSETSVVNYIARTPEAIGYVSMSAVTPDVHAMIVDDTPLNIETVESQKYPFVRTLTFIVPQTPDADMQAFIDFVLSAEGQHLIAQRHGRAPAQ